MGLSGRLAVLGFVLFMLCACFSTGGGSGDPDDGSAVDDDMVDDDMDDDTDDDDNYIDCADQDNLGYDEGDTMANFTLYDEEGNPQSLYDLCGHVVLLVSSTGWCPSCQYEAAHIVEDIYEPYHEQGLEIFYTLFEDANGNSPSQEYLQSYRDSYGLPFHVYNDQYGALFRYQDTYPLLYIPFNIVVDREMVVHYEGSGYSVGVIKSFIEALLDE